MNAKQRRVEIKHRKKKQLHRLKRKEMAQTAGTARPVARRTAG